MSKCIVCGQEIDTAGQCGCHVVTNITYSTVPLRTKEQIILEIIKLLGELRELD